MTEISNHPNRKRLRLANYDYSTCGAYFVTICTYKKQKTLCNIFRRGDPCGLPRTKLTELGKLAEETIKEICVENFVNVEKHVIMPNHIHILFMLTAPIGDSRKGCHYDISQLVGKYKSLVACKWLAVCKERNITMGQIWQRSFFDRIIRNEKDYLGFWKYIDENPLKWEFDKYYR